jgi:hypothetical protein
MHKGEGQLPWQWGSAGISVELILQTMGEAWCEGNGGVVHYLNGWCVRHTMLPVYKGAARHQLVANSVVLYCFACGTAVPVLLRTAVPAGTVLLKNDLVAGTSDTRMLPLDKGALSKVCAALRAG